MPSPQRQSRLYAIEEHCRAQILVLKEEISLFIDHPVGVSGHTSFLRDVEDKLAEMSEMQGILDVIDKEFK